MKRFKKRWEIQENWQLLFPLLGVLALLFSSYRLALKLTGDYHMFFVILTTIVLYFVFLKLSLFLFKKLEKKWLVNYRWEMIRIFIVFAVTGTSSLVVGRPIIKLLGITKDNLNPILYWILFIIIGLIFYQILLVFYGWLFGQFQFFWEFEKKMLRRVGLKRFLD